MSDSYRDRPPVLRPWVRLVLLGMGAAALAFLAAVLWPVLMDKPESASPPGAADRPANAIALLPGFDGNYYVTAKLNGVPVLFQVMAAAPVTILEPRDAGRAGLAPKEIFRRRTDILFAFAALAETRAKSLEIGPVELEDVRVFVRDDTTGVSVLGRDVLNRFKRWGRRVEGPDRGAFMLEY